MNIALIVAAGKGSRLASDKPKQFYLIDNKPMFSYSLETFHNVKEIDAIYVVTNLEGIKIVSDYVKKHHLNKVKGVLLGGSSRQESVFLGLLALRKSANEKDRILIHDAARALVSERVILDNIRASKKYAAVTTLVKVADTMNTSLDEKTVNEIIDRTYLYHVQTPQTFDYNLILKAHEKAKKEKFNGTDDVSLLMRMNEKIHFVLGERENFKITTMEDMKLFETIVLGRKSH